jgi:hypothetical protein
MKTLQATIRRRHFRMARSALLVIGLSALASFESASAHDARPAYMQVTEVAPQRYEVIWRTPVLSGMRLPVILRFPANTRNITEPVLRELSDSLVERRTIETGGGLTGTRIEIVGLQATITDALVRVQMLDGTYSTTLVRPSKPWIDLTASRGSLDVAYAYLTHGIEHILFGYDHLLFVLALILIVRSTRVLLLRRSHQDAKVNAPTSLLDTFGRFAGFSCYGPIILQAVLRPSPTTVLRPLHRPLRRKKPRPVSTSSDECLP